jgi:hypothetical protein
MTLIGRTMSARVPIMTAATVTPIISVRRRNWKRGLMAAF